MSKLTQQQQLMVREAISMLESVYTCAESEVEFTSPSKVTEYLKLRLAPLEREEFHVMYLNNRHKLIECRVESLGTINAASVYPREIAKSALELNASAVILSHNHPSGSTEISEADKQITYRLIEALGLFEIRVLDHIIIASPEKSVSFAEQGLL